MGSLVPNVDSRPCSTPQGQTLRGNDGEYRRDDILIHVTAQGES